MSTRPPSEWATCQKTPRGTTRHAACSSTSITSSSLHKRVLATAGSTQEQQEAGGEFGVWKEAQQAALGCASAARAHPRGAADELLGAEAPQKRIYQRGWCNLLG